MEADCPATIKVLSSKNIETRFDGRLCLSPPARRSPRGVYRPLERGSKIIEVKLSRFRRMTSPRNITRFWEWGRKIICVGRNYADHAKELSNAVPTEPVLFLKPPTAYVREGSPILVPSYCSDLHHEVELGVIIGEGGTTISQTAAMDHVAGYALCLDMTARDVQEDCKSKGLPWTLAKAFNTSCPVSEFIAKEKIPNPCNINIWLKVNGQLRQDGNTAQMIFSIPYLVSHISSIITLEEGDLILTGTPKGVSSVQEHDEIEAGIEGIVRMKFTVCRR